MKRGEHAKSIEGLSMAVPGDLLIEVIDAGGRVLCRSNPLRITKEVALKSYWCDLTASQRRRSAPTRRRVDRVRARSCFPGWHEHQGNDFQITTPFWNELNGLTREYNKDGRFIIFPGYEWSGNTGLGGDRNVMFMHEGRQIHRSSHALVDDTADVWSDSNSAEGLFKALKDEDCVVFAHIGGRYADIKMAHDARIERAVEVHSDWGTFEWLVRDALEQGYRIGILANSDGHKGRHGASHPGASMFGAYGGLSCLLSRELTRAGLFDALRRRHHYATTGCRMVLETRATFANDAKLYSDDPNVGPATHVPSRQAMMGDILQSADKDVEFSIEAHASAPIERLEIRDGLEVLETWRPYDEAALGRRIRVIWEGSEYRGRGRQTVWDGGCILDGNSFERITLDQHVEPRQEDRADRSRHARLDRAHDRRLRRFRRRAGRSAEGPPENRYRPGEMRHRRCRHRPRRPCLRGRRHPAPPPHFPAARRKPSSHPEAVAPHRPQTGRRQRSLRLPHAGGRSPVWSSPIYVFR